MRPLGSASAMTPPKRAKSCMKVHMRFSVERWDGCLNNGRIRHRYMGTLHSWKGKYHQLYWPWLTIKYRKLCLYSSLTAKIRPQINSTPRGCRHMRARRRARKTASGMPAAQSRM